jgi:hypothetical protein
MHRDGVYIVYRSNLPKEKIFRPNEGQGLQGNGLLFSEARRVAKVII